MCILTVLKTIWNCRDNNESNDDKWCILTAFGTAEIILTQGRFHVHYFDTFWNDIWNCHEKKQHMFYLIKKYAELRNPGFLLKIRTRIGALGHYLKIRAVNGAFWRYFLTCREKNEKLNGAFWRILLPVLDDF